jgi:hypothetical protein
MKVSHHLQILGILVCYLYPVLPVMVYDLIYIQFFILIFMGEIKGFQCPLQLGLASYGVFDIVIGNEVLYIAVSAFGFVVTGEGMREAAKGTASFQI